MSWDTTMPLLLRDVIGDTGVTPRYDDASLKRTLLSAAQLIQIRVKFSQSYTIDTSGLVLTPDPTDAGTRDDAFINLVTLKAACMLLYAEVRRYGQQAISIRDGTSAIDLKRNLKDLQNLAGRYCAELERSLNDFYYNGSKPGMAIIAPFKGNLFLGETCCGRR